MANYNLVRYGSTGDDVKNLQNMLNANGYELDVDGIFGSETQSAVRDYQKKNGLDVDGIVGDNTWASLNSSNNGADGNTNTGDNTDNGGDANNGGDADTNGNPNEPDDSGFEYDDFTYDDFSPSDILNDAWDILQQQKNNKPGEYTPEWKDEADDYLNQYQNRDPFSYDYNADALFQQYKDNYTRQGMMAMMDTMGQAAALTGGYGSSYAQTAGQQMYNQQLSQMNNILPELWQMSYDRYNQDGQNLLNMYNLYMDRESQEYARYQDNLDNWYRETDRLTNEYNDLYDREHGEWQEGRDLAYDDYLKNKDYAYDQWNIKNEREWEEYLQDQQDARDIAEILAGAGDYDRLKDIYGLTDEEIATLKASSSSYNSGTGNQGNQYLTLQYGSDTYKQFDRAIRGAKDKDDLNQITQQFLDLGYNPDDIYNMGAFKEKMEELSAGNEPQDTGVEKDEEPKLNNMFDNIPGIVPVEWLRQIR